MSVQQSALAKSVQAALLSGEAADLQSPPQSAAQLRTSYTPLRSISAALHLFESAADAGHIR